MNLVTILGGLMIVLSPKFMKKFADIVINGLGDLEYLDF